MTDLVLVSGHGGQVPDKNGDEEDELDESTAILYYSITTLVNDNSKLSGRSTSSTTSARKVQEK